MIFCAGSVAAADGDHNGTSRTGGTLGNLVHAKQTSVVVGTEAQRRKSGIGSCVGLGTATQVSAVRKIQGSCSEVENVTSVPQRGSFLRSKMY